jgi:hypothetical protein
MFQTQRLRASRGNGVVFFGNLMIHAMATRARPIGVREPGQAGACLLAPAEGSSSGLSFKNQVVAGEASSLAELAKYLAGI